MLLHVSVTVSRQFLPIFLYLCSLWHQRKTRSNYVGLSLASQSQNSWIKRKKKKKRISMNATWQFVPTLKYCDISLIECTRRSQRLTEQKWVKFCFNETAFVAFDRSFFFFFLILLSHQSVSRTQYKRLNAGHGLQLLVTIEKLPTSTSWHAWTGWQLASSLFFWVFFLRLQGKIIAWGRNKLLMQQTLKYSNKQQQVSQEVFYFLKALKLKNLPSQDELKVPHINSPFPCFNTVWWNWKDSSPQDLNFTFLFFWIAFDCLWAWQSFVPAFVRWVLLGGLSLGSLKLKKHDVNQDQTQRKKFPLWPIMKLHYYHFWFNEL